MSAGWHDSKAVSTGRRNELFLQWGLDDPNQLEFVRQIRVYVKSNFEPTSSMRAAIAASDCPSGKSVTPNTCPTAMVPFDWHGAEPAFNSDRKDTHWGKRKLKRDE
jgi:hypothetical protein